MSFLTTVSEKRARLIAWVFIGIVFYLSPIILPIFSNLSMEGGDMHAWLPDESTEKDIFEEFAEKFESYDWMLISWDGAKSEDPIFDEIAREIIVQDRTRAFQTGDEPLISTVRTFTGFRDLFGEERANDPDFVRKLKKEVGGFLTFKNEEEGFLALETSEYGSRNQARTYEMVNRVVRDFLPEMVVPKYTGPCFLTVCSNFSMWDLFVRIYPFTTLISFILAVIFLRTVKLATIALGVSGLTSILVITVMYGTGRQLGNFLTLVPSLTQLLAMSNVIHFINYYKESIEENGDKETAWRTALSQGWLPTMAAGISTAVGLAALTISDIYIVREFAVYSIIGVLISLVVVLCYTPSLLILLRPDVRESLPIQEATIRGMHRFVVKRKWLISYSLILLLIFGGFGLVRLQSDAALKSLFRKDALYQKNSDWYQSRIGSAWGSDLLVTFPYGVSLEEQFELIDQIGRSIDDLDPEYSVFSPSIFNDLLSDESVEKRWEKVQESSLGVKKHGKTFWRLMIRHPIDSDPNKSRFRSRSVVEIEKTIDESDLSLRKKPEFHLTGFVSLFLTTQSSLIKQLLISFLCAFLVITPLIMIFLRRLWIGLIAIIGNLFPLVVFFGILGWLSFRVDIATMMIATVAFGIAIDDTVHFLTWLSRGLKQKESLNQAIKYAFEHSAGAIMQTTLIISTGMSVYLLSDFIPSVRFASFSAIVLVIALIGDLILLPAMILGMFRGVFEKQLSSRNFKEDEISQSPAEVERAVENPQ